jgi:hypothetical protein
MLLSKEFKIISKSPGILKLRVGAASIELKNVEKMALT